MPDAQCFQVAREDPYYEKVVPPDEAELFEWETARLTVGWEEVYVQDGQVLSVP